MDNEKKIIIDEDWKNEAEESTQADMEAAQAAAEVQSESQEMPPASLLTLVSTLTTEIMIALGQIPHPASGQLQPNPDIAKYLIDTICMLQEKTKGNVDEDEIKMFEDLTHQLKMAYVAFTDAMKEAEAGEGPAKSPIIT